MAESSAQSIQKLDERTPLFEDDDTSYVPLFMEDAVGSADGCIPKKQGLLHRYDFVSEQQRTLNQLQQRSYQSRTRNVSATGTASPLAEQLMPKDKVMEPFQLDPIIHVSASGSTTVSKQILDEGEDPLSAPSSPPYSVTRRSSMWAEGMVSNEMDVEEIKSNPFEDDTDDADTRRRSRRLAFSLTIYLPHNEKLGMSISLLKDGSVAVTKLDLASNGDLGVAEAGGLRVHDRLLGKISTPSTVSLDVIHTNIFCSLLHALNRCKLSTVFWCFELCCGYA